MTAARIDEAERLRLAEKAAGRAGIGDWPNVVEMFFAQAERHAEAPFLWSKSSGSWRAISWRTAAEQVARIATALGSLGLEPKARIVLVSENRPEFCLWDLGIMAAGFISVPTYTTNTARDHQHILENSGASAAIVSTAVLARPLLQAAYRSTRCRHIISFERLAPEQVPAGLTFDQAGRLLAAHPAAVAAVRAGVTATRADLACIIYTSGTGGVPRGVMQHHGAILHNVTGCADILHNDFEPTAGADSFLSFLPGSHAYEHTCGQFFPIGLGAQIHYAESLEKLARNIEEVAPTAMIVVPRLFEVLRSRITKSIAAQGGLAPMLLEQALALARVRAARGRLPLHKRPMDALVERLLRRRIRARFGGRLKALVSGGAPLNPDVGLFFEALGITLLQGYGQTEAGPVISCNRPAAGVRMDSVGPPLRDVEVRIAEDGEILVAGELVMHGYWRDDLETGRVLGTDGWLHTGDLGRLDDDGHLVITGRKKDIIINDKGDNVAPQRVEGMLTLEDEIGQAMVYGDRRPYLVGLIVPNSEFMLQWAARTGIPVQKLAQDGEFVRAVQAAVDRVNRSVAAVEKVRRIMIADEPFTIENAQLTPSLKIRRHILKDIYGARLEALYHRP